MSEDNQAIKELHETFKLQKAAFLKNQYPSYEERMGNLGKLAQMMVANRQEIRDALKKDFGVHPDGLSDLIECLTTAGRAAEAMKQLKSWMADDSREADPQMYGSARVSVRQEPKGVIACMAPFNFPYALAMGPVCEMLAAGNRIIVRPSELTPHSSAQMKKMINATFDRDHVDVALGGLAVSKEFITLPWDHILYTGSVSVGKLVMKAAAQNLTPVTLELGGKNSVIVLEDRVNAATVESIIGVKGMKSGQLCVTPDTLHVPRNKVDEFCKLAIEYTKSLGQFSKSEDCAGICTERHLQRLIDIREEAVKSGARVVDVEEGATVNLKTRQMPLSIIVEPSEDLRVVQEELFGPLLVLRPYDDLEEVINYVNSKARPLGVYVFTDDDAKADYVIEHTNSGGACQNVCVVQAAIPTLPFGGSGYSGMGRHNGIEGFREFSNPKGVVRRGKGPDGLSLLHAPYANGVAVADAAIAAMG